MSRRIFVLAGICAGLGLALVVGPRDGERADPPALVLPALGGDPSAARTFTVERPGEPTVRLARTGAGWRVVEPVDAPADRRAVAAVESLFAGPVRLDPAFPVTEDDLGLYGLAGEGIVVTLGSSGSARLHIGKVIDGGWTFVRPLGPAAGDRSRYVYRARGDLRRLFDRGVTGWRERRLFTVEGAELARLALRAGDRLRWAVTRPESDAPWRFEVPAGLEAGQTEVGGVAHALATLKADAFPPPAETAAFAPALTIEARTFGDERIGVELSAPRPDGSALVRRLGDGLVVRVSGHQIAFLDRDAEALRERRLLAVPADDLRALVVTTPEQTLRLVRDADGAWRLEAPILVNPVPPDRMAPLLEALSDLRAAGFPRPVPPDAFEEPAARVEAHLAGDRRVTLTLGAEFRAGALYARTSERPDRIGVISASAVRALTPTVDDLKPPPGR